MNKEGGSQSSTGHQVMQSKTPGARAGSMPQSKSTSNQLKKGITTIEPDSVVKRRRFIQQDDNEGEVTSCKYIFIIIGLSVEVKICETSVSTKRIAFSDLHS